MKLSEAARRLAIGAGARRWAVLLCTLAVIGLAWAAPLPIDGPAPQRRDITVTAHTFEFAPGTVRVNRGDTVTVRLESADVVHGFYVDGYGVLTHAEPGRPGEVTFVADRTGAFHFRCAVPCGNLHPFMIGKLIVEPNLAWLRALLSTVLAAVGALVAFWRA
jgi:heme/copper-type cytochrome/quinol oxidase subunit 2